MSLSPTGFLPPFSALSGAIQVFFFGVLGGQVQEEKEFGRFPVGRHLFDNFKAQMFAFSVGTGAIEALQDLLHLFLVEIEFIVLIVGHEL